VHCAFSLRAVAINARDRVVGKTQPQCVFEAFSSFAKRPDGFAAFAAGRVQRPDMPAVVTAQLSIASVHG
jgi:hypothetical protein